MPETIKTWREALRAAGHEPGEVLGSGMEGIVVALGDDRVAKIWLRRTATELARLRAFYDAVGAAGLPFTTPVIEAVVVSADACASIEPRRSGTRLWRPMGEILAPPTDEELAAVVTVLAALGETHATPAMSALPVLEGEGAFDPEVRFEDNLAALVERRVESSRGPLTRALPDLDEMVARVVAALHGLPPGRATLVHGDLVPANVLVDEQARPTALLDFGYLSTVGDPAFEAAVAASVFDMYGPGAAVTERRLEAAIHARLGHPADRLGVYRAAYALATATTYSAAGDDGHFAWCVRMLQRDDVRDALTR